MPIYMYEVVSDDPDERQTFELLQDVHEAALAVHPETGLAVRRIISAPAVVGTTRSSHERHLLSDKNIAAKGFSRYQRVGSGTYARTAGSQGPEVINKP